MCWNAKYVLLLLFSTVVSYCSGLAIDLVRNREEIPTYIDKVVVIITFLLNLGVLGFYKYWGFIANLSQQALNQIGIQIRIPSYNIILPIGISFFTFQSLSYTMDVYRRDVDTEKNFFRYALFVSFFPQLLSGPITLSKNLLGQFKVQRKITFDTVKEGFLLMLWGYYLKLVLADRIALFVNTIYDQYYEFGGWYLIVATVLFAVQIYCDFAGYSTIAYGAAIILGIKLANNFDAPYLSVSISDFWRRWHISLTSWFREYLYFPLGGSRKGKVRKYINVMIVFLVSGLWHGASLSFLVWGGLNGVYHVIEEISSPIRDKWVKILHLHRNSITHKMARGLITFLLVDFTWIFLERIDS